MTDINKLIKELVAEKRRLDRAIENLERRQKGQAGGRVWSSEARQAAADRMRKYWEARRKPGKPSKNES